MTHIVLSADGRTFAEKQVIWESAGSYMKLDESRLKGESGPLKWESSVIPDGLMLYILIVPKYIFDFKLISI